MPLTNYSLDNFIAPKLSQLTNCVVPALPDLENYFDALVLNYIFILRYDQPVFVLVLTSIKRLEGAVAAYQTGRSILNQYISELPQQRDLAKHRSAILNFETCLIHTYISVVCFNAVAGLLKGPTFFTIGDGSPPDRLRLIYNRIKHFDEDVDESAKARKVVPLAPTWITNDGFESNDTSLLFSELADVLKNLISLAKVFAEDLPKREVDRRNA
jgi:hypothetical protein